MLNGSAVRWVKYRLGLRRATSQLTEAERACLARHAAGRRYLVEIGVYEGATTALLRSVMDPGGVITGIDPHPPGRLWVNFERAIALHEIGRQRRGQAVLRRELSYEAACHWDAPIDFLFIDGDHSWSGIDRDWKDWRKLVIPGGLVVLHDSRPVPWRSDHESVRYTQTVILADPLFSEADAVDSLTVLARRTMA